MVGVEWIVCGDSSYSSSCDDSEIDRFTSTVICVEFVT